MLCSKVVDELMFRVIQGVLSMNKKRRLLSVGTLPLSDNIDDPLNLGSRLPFRAIFPGVELYLFPGGS